MSRLEKIEIYNKLKEYAFDGAFQGLKQSGVKLKTLEEFVRVMEQVLVNAFNKFWNSNPHHMEDLVGPIKKFAREEGKNMGQNLHLQKSVARGRKVIKLFDSNGQNISFDNEKHFNREEFFLDFDVDPIAIRLGLVDPPKGDPVGENDCASDPITLQIKAVRSKMKWLGFVQSNTDGSKYKRRFLCSSSRGFSLKFLIVEIEDGLTEMNKTLYARGALHLEDNSMVVCLMSENGCKIEFYTFKDYQHLFTA